MSKLTDRAMIIAGMLANGERIKWGEDSTIIEKLVAEVRRLEEENKAYKDEYNIMAKIYKAMVDNTSVVEDKRVSKIIELQSQLTRSDEACEAQLEQTRAETARCDYWIAKCDRYREACKEASAAFSKNLQKWDYKDEQAMLSAMYSCDKALEGGE